MRRLSIALLLVGCGARTRAEPEHARPPLALRAPTSEHATAAEASPKPEAQPAEPALPPGIEPGKPVLLTVPGDHALRVVHGVATTREAIVYLHGVCGDPDAFQPWAEVASRHGTLIGLLGDTRCKGSSRYRWEATTSEVDRRIDQALGLVAQARGGLLDTSHPILMGYSQGALRVEALVKHFPDKYGRVVLGSPPVEPHESALESASRIAILGGEREQRDYMLAASELLRSRGRSARFFLLPGASHGQYGPEGPRVMDEVLGYVQERAEPSATPTPP